MLPLSNLVLDDELLEDFLAVLLLSMVAAMGYDGV
jgi:hypothetical protein